MDRNPITPAGYERLKNELHHAKSVLRPEVVKQIEEARAHGDLSENAEYDMAKDKQGLLEARINHMESTLALAEVIDIDNMPPGDKVIFGARVDLLNVETEEKFTYQIVSDYETNVKQGLISFNSPIGRSLIGKEAGDEAKVRTPKGERIFEVLEVYRS